MVVVVGAGVVVVFYGVIRSTNMKYVKNENVIITVSVLITYYC